MLRVLSALAIAVIVYCWPQAGDQNQTGTEVVTSGTAATSTELFASDRAPASDLGLSTDQSIVTATSSVDVAGEQTESVPRSDVFPLEEIRPDVFESPAGLLYLPGSADGHRLQHIMKHAQDDVGKPIHGVFEGDRDSILAMIDEAFLKSKTAGPDVRSSVQNRRFICTVNLRRRIGYVGGAEAQSRGRRQECRFLRIVLENDREIITAYPTKSF